MMIKGVVAGRAVEVLGAKGSPCYQCRRLTAEYPYWGNDTVMMWVCTFCESGLYALQSQAAPTRLEADDLD